MVKIRLKRMGMKKNPFYRVVVADERAPRDGRFIDEIGYYDPMKKPEAIIRSMTPQERHHPEVLNASRRRRIAAGAGVTVQDVNQLMRQYDQARQLVKSMMGNKRGALRQLRNMGKQ